jgi:hypothetical protein
MHRPNSFIAALPDSAAIFFWIGSFCQRLRSSPTVFTLNLLPKWVGTRSTASQTSGRKVGDAGGTRPYQVAEASVAAYFACRVEVHSSENSRTPRFFVTISGDGPARPVVLMSRIPREEFVLMWRGNNRV